MAHPGVAPPLVTATMYKLISINTEVHHKAETAAGGSEKCRVEKNESRCLTTCRRGQSEHAKAFAVCDGFQ